jgi:glycosyltransferase involved in cell wall biosynthesis
MVSVIIPCYNCEAFIERAVNSVLNQTFTDWELILVNNNSTDQTLPELNRLQALHSDKIRVLTAYKKGGSAARNKGLNDANGNWIQFLDADDELLPGKIEHQLRLIQHNSADVVIGNSNVRAIRDGVVVESVRPLASDIWTGLIKSNLGITSANLWKKETLLAVDGWDEELTSSQEYDLLFRLLKAGAEICIDRELFTIIHQMSDSVSKSKSKEKLKSILTNRIDLRNQIREFLYTGHKLTWQLDRTIDTYIYGELMNFRDELPEFVSERFAASGFNLSLSFKLKQKWKIYKSMIKSTVKITYRR